MRKYFASLCVFMAASAAHAEHEQEAPSTQTYISTLCTITGEWSGRFERHGADGIYASWGVELDYTCPRDHSTIAETRSLLQENGASSNSHKVLSSNKVDEEIHISYFREGRVETYYFETRHIDYRDSDHWTLIREASTKVAATDPTPPVSRYTHRRNGNELTVLREVKTSHSKNDWILSSKIILTAKKSNKVKAP